MQGGVAILAEQSTPLADHVLSHTQAALYDTKRWVPATLILGKGVEPLHVRSIYGIAGARGDTLKYSENERLIRDSLIEAAALGCQPVILSLDANIGPEESEVLALAIASGRWVDVADHFTSHDPPMTYCKEGIHQTTQKQKGASIIDQSIANRPAMMMIASYTPRFDLTCPGHLPQHIEFRLGKFHA